MLMTTALISIPVCIIFVSVLVLLVQNRNSV